MTNAGIESCCSLFSARKRNASDSAGAPPLNGMKARSLGKRLFTESFHGVDMSFFQTWMIACVVVALYDILKPLVDHMLWGKHE